MIVRYSEKPSKQQEMDGTVGLRATCITIWAEKLFTNLSDRIEILHMVRLRCKARLHIKELENIVMEGPPTY